MTMSDRNNVRALIEYYAHHRQAIGDNDVQARYICLTAANELRLLSEIEADHPDIVAAARQRLVVAGEWREWFEDDRRGEDLMKEFAA